MTKLIVLLSCGLKGKLQRLFLQTVTTTPQETIRSFFPLYFEVTVVAVAVSVVGAWRY